MTFTMVAQPLRQFCLLGTHIFIHIFINLADCPGGKPANTPAAPSPIAIPKNGTMTHYYNDT